MAGLEEDEQGEEDTEEKGGGEGTRVVFHLLPQQTCKQQQ